MICRKVSAPEGKDNSQRNQETLEPTIYSLIVRKEKCYFESKLISKS